MSYITIFLILLMILQLFSSNLTPQACFEVIILPICLHLFIVNVASEDCSHFALLTKNHGRLGEAFLVLVFCSIYVLSV